MADLVIGHKDARPEDTVQRIRGILNQLGILTHEAWQVFSDHCYSVRIEDAAFPVGTNGKGTTRSYTLASGYAEFMERVQNGFLYRPEYGLVSRHRTFHPDEVLRPATALWEEQPEVFEALTGLAREDGVRLLPTELRAAPFYEVQSGAMAYLPIELIHHACGSNGMCAGNSPAEALVQGLSEILERFAIREVFLRKLPVPTIPLAELENTKSYRLIQTLLERGYVCLVKDLTLGGTVPVVGVLVLSPDRTRFSLSVGADPVLDVALQRSLTEVAQGWSAGTFESKMRPIDGTLELHAGNLPTEVYRFCCDGRGLCPPNVFASTHEPRYREAFGVSYSGNAGALHWLARVLKERGRPVYVRDVSFLGFPSYQVYVPGLAETVTPALTPPVLRVIQSAPFLRRCLLSLERTSPQEITRCIELLELARQTPLFGFDAHGSATYQRWPCRVKLKDPVRELVSEFVLAVLSHRVGDHGRAYRYFREYLELDGGEITDPGFTQCMLAYLRLKADGVDEAAVERTLTDLYGTDLASEVIADLHDPQKAFQHLTLPACGDCDACTLREHCLHDAWDARLTSLKRTMAERPIDQRALAAVFQA